MTDLALRQRAWLWLMQLAYRHARIDVSQKPIGIPGNRDPDNICHAYAPRKRQAQDWQDCSTDGHFLCQVCAHRELSIGEARARGVRSVQL